MELVEPGDPVEIARGLSQRLEDPIGVFAAPGRANLIGEHTDYNAGLCLPIALPHATYVAVERARQPDFLYASSRQQDMPLGIPMSAIAPRRQGGWTGYVAGVVWALREAGHEVPALTLYIDSRVPLGSGLSSSASLICATALAVCAAAGVELTREELVPLTIRVESEFVRAPTGGLDQTASLLAEEGHALLLDFADDSMRRVRWRPEDAGLQLLVVDTRTKHTHTDGGYGDRREECEAAARELGVDTLREATLDDVRALSNPMLRNRARHVVTEIARVADTVEAVEAGDWRRVGELFNESHISMRRDFTISTPELDEVVATAVAAGALGARMTGGGFGGSAIALVPTDRVETVCDEIAAEFDARGWATPGILPAPASASARQVS